METLFENRYTVNLRMLRSFSRGASFSQKFFPLFPGRNGGLRAGASLLSAISSW